MGCGRVEWGGYGVGMQTGAGVRDGTGQGAWGIGQGRVGVVARVGLHAEKLRHATHGALRPPGATRTNSLFQLRYYQY